MLLLSILATQIGAAEEDLSKPILVLDTGGHTATVWKILFAPDAEQLITVSDDKTIRMWDVASGHALRVLHPPIGRGDEGRLYAAALSPDGRTLAVGGYGYEDDQGRIYLVALPAGTTERVLKGHGGTVRDLVFSRDGRRLASASHDTTARVWDVQTGRCERVLEGHTDRVFAVAFSPDGSRLATASFDRTGRVWSITSGQVQATLAGHQAEVRTIAWSPDGRTIATGSYDESVCLWNPDGTPRQRFANLGKQVISITCSSDSKTLVATLGSKGSGKHGARLIDIESGRVRLRFEQHENTVSAGAISPDGALAATAGGDSNEICLWKTADGTVVHRLFGSGRTIVICAWSPNSEHIAWGNTRAQSPLKRLDYAFDLSDLEFIAPSGTDWQRAVLSRGEFRLAKGDDYHVLVKQGDQTLATVELEPAPDGWMRCLTFLSGHQAAVGASRSLRLFDIRTGKSIHRFHGHTGTVWAIAPSPDGRYLLSASGDQTLRIWDPDREDPLVSLFFAGKEWIAWTPEGYYAASPGGERLVGWHVNNGLEQMASYYPAAQFRKSLYRPDVIKLLLETGSTPRALELADQQRGRASQLTRAEEVLPPQVVITAPSQAQFQVSQPQFELRATATPKGRDPITSLRVLVDGRPNGEMKRAGQTAQPLPVQESWSVVLTPGVHQVAVKAETAKSYGMSEPVEVTYAWREIEAELPVLFVLAVGISDYQDRKLRLGYGAADARGLAETLQKKAAGVYRKVEAKVLVDAAATQRGLLRGLEWLRTQMTQRDVGIVFFAGHGAKDDQGLFYLVPADCTAAELTVGGIGEDQIKRFCQSIPGRLMLLLDACHTGAMGGDKRRALGGLTDNLVRDLVTDDYGVIVMCSSMGREESREQDQWGHGAFTMALIEGLEGRADFNRDRTVYFSELDLYVTDRVKELTEGHQHPVTQKPTTIRSFPIARP